MKKLNALLSLLIVAIIGFAFTSCEKEEIEKNLTKAQMVVKNWSYTAIEGQENLPECLTDDKWDFKADGTYTLKVGEKTCFGEKDMSGQWSLSEDGSELTLTDNGITTKYTVVSISLTKIVLEYKVLGAELLRVTLE